MKSRVLHFAASAALGLCLVAATSVVSAKKPSTPVYKDPSAPIEKRVDDLLSRMTLEEKIMQLNQYGLGKSSVENNLGEKVKAVPAEAGSVLYTYDNVTLRNMMQKKCVEETRLGIPMVFGYDVIHGYRTIAPIPLAQAASWNPSLVKKVSANAAREAYYGGVDWAFSPMVDIARDPRWGRVMEGYGEDTYLASVFCKAAVEGYQGNDLSAPGTVAACLKHFVGYGASEAGRDYVYTEISDQSLWDTYLPPFHAGVDAGAATVMSAFNNINGIPASANKFTMTDILKKRWNWDGVIVSDWFAVQQLINQGAAQDELEAAALAINAGIDMDMMDDLYRQHLDQLIKDGKVSMEVVDECVRRILRLKFKLGLFEHPYIEELPENEIYLRPEAVADALQLAQESMVLLKNENAVLPLKNVSKIALIGPMADTPDELLGNWAARGRASDVVSILEGMKKEFSGAEIVYAKGCDFDKFNEAAAVSAVEAAKSADVVVLCLGEKRKWSGENCSRSSIALPDAQEKLLEMVKGAGKPVVVLVASGRPVDLSRIAPKSDALVEIWMPGITAGTAVSSILSGKYNPSGRLPMTFPYATGQIPIYYNRRSPARRGTQGLYKDIQSEPMYEFGYGLSYSSFKYSDVTLSSDSVSADGTVTASVTVTNVSDVDGAETVQWYVCDPVCSITRPVKELKHFEKAVLKAGESKTFTFEIVPMRDLSFVDSHGDKLLEKGEYRIIVKDSVIVLHLL